jgi:1A family penicillin-binding protein
MLRQWRTLLALGLSAFFIISGAVAVWTMTFKIPTLQSIQERRVAESTKIYDKTGNVLLYDVSQNTKRTIVPIEEISKYAREASIAIEDKDFYEHRGVKPTSFIRAMLVNLTSLSFDQGGSTITQQVIKNSILTNEKWISRKLKEWVLAIQLEKSLSKDEILSMYLNEIPYGGTIYGIEEASQTFYHKNAKYVTLAEAAYLASIPKAPTFYSPYGKNKDRLEARKNLVLKQMYEQELISEEDYNKAKEEKVEFKPKEDSSIKAPHFVFYLIEYLTNKYGEEVIEKGGLKVISTLDYEMQVTAEEIAKQFALQNEKTYNASNAAIVAIDPKTGGILTMVGSRDYFDKEIDGAFNVTTAKRQPGSTFKPFVYSVAFNKGFLPQTVLFDVKTQFSTSCTPDNPTSENGCYSPDNYDSQFRGPVSMRDALAQSLNIPAVKTLYLAGLNPSINLSRDMGLSTISNKGDYGLTLVLGGGEVTPLEITSAYGVFANQGQRNDHTPILEITDKNGATVEKLEPRPREVLTKETTLLISDVLSDNVARAPAYGQTSYLHFPSRDVAVKTGTTNDYRDAWIIGYTPNIAVGAWAGNNDNSPMEKKVAGFIVAPMWRAFMDKALTKLPDERFEEPIEEVDLTLKPILRGNWKGGNSVLIDKVSGKLATEFTPKETLAEITTGGVHSILFWVDKNDPRGPIPQNPGQDSQFNNWEYAVKKWAFDKNIIEDRNINIPPSEDDVHIASKVPTVSIVAPQNGSNLRSSEKTNISLNINNSYPITKVEIVLNGIVVGRADSKILNYQFSPSDYGIPPGNYKLVVSVVDSVWNKTSTEMNVVVE